MVDKLFQSSELSSHDGMPTYHSTNNGFIHYEVHTRGRRLVYKQFLTLHTKVDERIYFMRFEVVNSAQDLSSVLLSLKESRYQ